ncbi:hypothetical protein [Flavobacterium sp.]|jgi:hypothetical protein|uniref:hypothetical protein n=1 Tax=Flavobacterium sp. TaxID=239 RepID=UPI0037BEE96A
MAFITKDVVISQLFVALAIIIGALASKHLSPKIQNKMNKLEQLNLIEGNFSDEEAKEILMGIFLAKINFHEKKIFSSQIRFGKVDEIAINRIPKLKKETEKMLQIISEAKLNNKRLLITSQINISLVDE